MYTTPGSRSCHNGTRSCWVSLHTCWSHWVLLFLCIPPLLSPPKQDRDWRRLFPDISSGNWNRTGETRIISFPDPSFWIGNGTKSTFGGRGSLTALQLAIIRNWRGERWFPVHTFLLSIFGLCKRGERRVRWLELKLKAIKKLDGGKAWNKASKIEMLITRINKYGAVLTDQSADKKKKKSRYFGGKENDFTCDNTMI